MEYFHVSEVGQIWLLMVFQFLATKEEKQREVKWTEITYLPSVLLVQGFLFPEIRLY